MYMDDLVIAAENTSQLSKQMNTVAEFAAIHGCVINMTKGIQIIEKNAKTEVLEWLKSRDLAESCVQPTLKYLGLHISLAKGAQQWDNHAEGRRKAALGSFFSMRDAGLQHGEVNWKPALDVFQTHILPSLFYGAELMTLTADKILRLDRTQKLILCKILGVHWSASVQWVLWECGALPAKIALQLAKVKKWRQIKNTKSQEWSNLDTEALSILTSWGKGKLWYTDHAALPGKSTWNKDMTKCATDAHAIAYQLWRASRKSEAEPPPVAFKLLHGGLNPALSVLSSWEFQAVMNARANTMGCGWDNKGVKSSQAFWPCADCGAIRDTLAHATLSCQMSRETADRIVAKTIDLWCSESKRTWVSLQDDDAKLAMLLSAGPLEEDIPLTHKRWALIAPLMIKVRQRVFDRV
jgi:hypothetical protein